MNANFYKVIFSKRLGTLIAVGENATANGKAASGQATRHTKNVCLNFVGAIKLASSLVALTYGINSAAQVNIPTSIVSSNTLPSGALISAGTANISSTGAHMRIAQTSDKASINWQSFNIGTGASVNIAQPHASAVLLNRVVGNDPSQILGKLSANGQVVLLNPNGILFGKDGSVTASAFTASTFGISDADFMNGYFKYNRNGSTAAVINQGTIEVAPGGFVALIGANVSNEGKIIAPQGDVILAAAESVTLPDPLTKASATSANDLSVRMSKRIRLELTPSAINAAVSNSETGLIVTEGGQVLLQAATLSSAVASVTHSGNIDTSAYQGGTVSVLADNGIIHIDGTIKANSSGSRDDKTFKGGSILIGRDEETGAIAKNTNVRDAKLESYNGFIETSGEHLIVDGIQIKAAQWLLDPTDITISSVESGVANSGANPLTQSPNTTGATASSIDASTLSNTLASGTSVVIQTTNSNGTGNGDITVASNIAVAGSTDATLTLKAERDILINDNISISRAGSNKLNVILNSDSDGNNSGAIVMKSGSRIQSNGGNITFGGGLAGDGSGNAVGNSTNIHGVSLTSATVNASGGNIAIHGTGGSVATLSPDIGATGFYMTNGGSISTTGAGTINIAGTGAGTSASTQSVGVRITSISGNLSTISGGSSGSVSIQGTGSSSATGNNQHGVMLSYATITSAGGNVSITGTGGNSGTGGSNKGISAEIGTEISATGAGTVTVNATGGTGTGTTPAANNNLGIGLNNGATIQSASGAISITANAPDNASYAASLAGTISSSANANIAIISDSVALSGTVAAGTGTVSIQNQTAGTLITVGGTSTDARNTSPKTLVIDATELSKITAGTTTIGRNDGPSTKSGTVTVSATDMGALGNTSGNLSVLSGNNISISGAITKSSGTDATLTLSADNGIDVDAAIGATNGSVGKLNVNMTASGNATVLTDSKGIAITKVINANSGTVNLTATNKNTAQNKYGISFGNGSGISASAYTVSGTQTLASTNSGGFSAGIYFSGTSVFTSTGASVMNGINNSQFTAFTAGTWFDDAANVSFNAGASGSVVIKGSNPNWKTGIRVGRGGGSSTPTVTTNGDVSLGSLDTDGSNFTYRNGSIIANSGTLSILGRGGNNSVSLYDGYAITGNNGASINITGQLNGASGTAVNIGPQGNASVVTNGGGNITITANATTSGGTALALGTVASGVTTAPTLISSGTITINATATGTGTSITSSTASTIAATGGLTVNNNLAGTLNGIISGGTANAGGLTKSGAGTLTLGNANTFKGTTLISAGTLALNNVNALQSSTLDTGIAGTQLLSFAMSGSNTYNLGGLQGSDDLAINANSISVGANNSSTTYSGILSGSGALTKVGTGNLTLSGQSTKTGTYNANGGTLTLTGASGTYREMSGLNININNGATVLIPNITSGGFVSTNMIWTFGSTGGGTLGINANFVNRGVNGNKFITTGGLTNTITGNLNLDANGGGAGPTFDVALATGGAAGLIHTGNTSNGNAAQTLTKTGAGTLILSGTNAYKGAIAVNAGVLQVGNGGTTGVLGDQSGTITVASGADLKVNRSNAINLGNGITGAGNLSQIGTGTLTLTGTNTYSGTTTVSAGTLQVGNAGMTGSLGSGAVTLSNNANLNFVRATATTLSNDVSGTGNLNATISGSNSDFTINSIVNITGALDASATGSITVSGGKNITTTSGTSLAGQSGVNLYAHITNSSSGAISIRAGDGTNTSTAAIQSAAGATITQNAAAAVTMTTDALGDLTAAKIIKGAGAGDITIASGVQLAAGAVGGNVKTVAGNSITNNGSGKTLIFTGSDANSGLMSNLHTSFANLYVSANTGQTQNAASLTAFGAGSGLAGGPANQVLFRQAVDLSPSISGATITQNYGDTPPTASEIATALSAANNGATTTASSNAGTLVASTLTVINDLANHAVLGTSANSFGRINANASGYAYTESGSSYAANGASPNLTLIVNKINAAVTANSDITKIYNGTSQTVTGFTATGLLSGETTAALTSVTSGVSATNAGTYSNVASGTDTNYNLSFTNGSMVIGKANLSLTGSRSYDASTSFAGSHLTANGVNNETFAILGSGDATNLSSKNVQSNQALASVTGLTLGSSSNGGLSSNYNAISTSGSSVSITPASLTVTGANTNTSYSGLPQTNSAAALSGLQGNESVSISGYGSGTNASSTAYADNLSVTANAGTSLNNYTITYVNGGITIGKANLSLTGSRSYDASTSFAGSHLTANGVNNETFAILGSGDATNLSSKNVQSNQALASITGLTLGSSSNGGLSSNYNAISTSGSSVSITPASLTVTGANTNTSYSGLPQTNSAAALSGLQGNESVSISGYGSGTNASSTAYADNLSVTANAGTSLNNYTITYVNGGITIGKANLTVTGSNNTSSYNGFTQTNTGAIVSGAIGTDTFTISGYGSGVNANSAAYADNLTITGNGATSVSNYNVNYVNGGLTIGKVNLTIKANDDARFVSVADTIGFNGASYIGLVGNDTSSSLSGALTITRLGANTDLAADRYIGKLVPSGFTSNNYNISYVNGDYTIVPANTLLIKTTNQTLSYGTTPSFNSLAQYLDANNNVIHTLTQTSSGNLSTFSDGAGGAATLTLKPYASSNATASISSSGNTVVGSYNVFATDTTVVGNNFNGNPVFIGVLNVIPKAVTVSAGNVSKVYDATSRMSQASLSLNGAITPDALTVSGSGAYDQVHAGQGLRYTFNNLSLSGADAANYFINGGNTIARTDGVISPAPLVISTSNVTKVYDGTTSANGSIQLLQSTQLYGSDTLSGGNFTFTDPSVGLGNKVVMVSGVSVNDGNGGANYVVSYLNNTQSSITASPLPASPIKPNGDSKPLLTFPWMYSPAFKQLGLNNCKSGPATDCVCQSQSGGAGNEVATCGSSNNNEANVRSKIDTLSLNETRENINETQISELTN